MELIVKIYFKLIIPLAKPILACIIVFAAVNQWNAWADDMYFMQGRKSATLHCLQYLLYTKLQSNVVSSTAGAAAGAAIKSIIDNATYGNELYYCSSDTLCLSIHAALFYKGNYAWCSKRLRNVILC